MRVRLREEARLDLVAIEQDGIERFGVQAAATYVDGLFERMDTLIDFPKLGYVPVEGTDVRALVHGPHIILYRAEKAAVTVLAVRNGRENWHQALSG